MADQENEQKKPVKKQIIYRLTEEGHDRLRELAFRETVRHKKTHSQSKIIDIAIEEMYRRNQRFWNA